MPNAEKVSLGMAISHAIALLYTHGCLTQTERDAARRRARGVKDDLVTRFPDPRPSDEFELKVCSGVTGQSVYLNDYRIAGPKPYGGGKVTNKWVVYPKDVVAACAN